MLAEDHVEKEKKIRERLQVVCICKGIRKGKILDAIESGCCSREKINAKTGSGSGGCNATRCGPVIEKLLADTKK
jgi:NAD(P)H-nitrite reductase large subunit